MLRTEDTWTSFTKFIGFRLFGFHTICLLVKADRYWISYDVDRKLSLFTSFHFKTKRYWCVDRNSSVFTSFHIENEKINPARLACRFVQHVDSQKCYRSVAQGIGLFVLFSFIFTCWGGGQSLRTFTVHYTCNINNLTVWIYLIFLLQYKLRRVYLSFYIFAEGYFCIFMIPSLVRSDREKGASPMCCRWQPLHASLARPQQPRRSRAATRGKTMKRQQINSESSRRFIGSFRVRNFVCASKCWYSFRSIMYTSIVVAQPDTGWMMACRCLGIFRSAAPRDIFRRSAAARRTDDEIQNKYQLSKPFQINSRCK